MKQNEDEIEKAEEISKDLGVDLLRFVPVGIPYDFADKEALKEKWFPATAGSNRKEHKPRPLTTAASVAM